MLHLCQDTAVTLSLVGVQLKKNIQQPECLAYC